MKDAYLGHRVKPTFHEEVKTSNQSKYTSEKDRLQAKIKTQDLTDLHESLRNPKTLSATDKLYKKELQELVDSIKHIEKEEYVSVSLWDFAGDKEFYNTHQTFFSEEAIYLVVTKLNETDDETNGIFIIQFIKTVSYAMYNTSICIVKRGLFILVPICVSLYNFAYATNN